MSYYINIAVRGYTFNEAIQNLKDELRKEGFDVHANTDLSNVFSAKLGIPFRKYVIISACNPAYMYRALFADEKAGVLNPCNFVIQEYDDGRIEITVVDPAELMTISDNDNLKLVANQLQRKIWQIIRHLHSAEVIYA